MSTFVYGPDYLPYLQEQPKRHWAEHPTPRAGLSLRLTRESLGISANEFADYVTASLRAVQYWEASEAIPGFAETALQELEKETTQWIERISGQRNIIIHREGYRQCGASWMSESWWRALVGKAVSATNATAAMAIGDYTPSPVWQDGDYLRFEVAGPDGDEEFRTGCDGQGLYIARESGGISLPSRTPIIEWKEILGASQFQLGVDTREDKHAINKLLKDLEVRDMARRQGLDTATAAIEIGARYIGR